MFVTKQKISTNYVLLTLLVATILGLYAYYLINNKGFFWDDDWAVVNNPNIQSLAPSKLKGVFTTAYYAQYSPVNTLVYCLIYAVFGLDPYIFHLASVLLHIGNTLLVYQLVLKILKLKTSTKEQFKSDTSYFATTAFLTALLFGISPMQIESVAWVSASKILLYTLFYLMGLISYLNFLSTRRKIQLVYCAFLFILSCGSKEQAVVFPLSLVIIYFYIYQSFNKSAILALSPFFYLSLFSGLASYLIQKSGFQVVFDKNYYPFWQRIFLACFSIMQYLLKIVFPFQLNHNYKFPMRPGADLPVAYYLYVISVCVGIYLLYKIRNSSKYQALFFGVTFFIVNMILAVHLIPLGRTTMMAERYVYLATIGPFFVLADFFSVRIHDKKTLIKGLSVLGIGAYILFFIVVSVVYLNSWTILAEN